MLRLFGSVMLLGFLSLGWAARPAASTKKAVKKSGSSKTTAKKSTAKSGTARKSASKAGSRRVAASRTPARKTASWRSRQAQPTADRYKQIQQALAAKGYLKDEDATGVWGPNCVDALKRFQDDQKIEGAGKINSLSLIALGLGPKRENLAVTKPQPPQPPPPPVQ
jgi:peptidoglycan hydrolase-like protein with peptidoglycan-binding domain